MSLSKVLHQIGMYFESLKVGFLFVVEAQRVSVVAEKNFSLYYKIFYKTFLQTELAVKHGTL